LSAPMVSLVPSLGVLAPDFALPSTAGGELTLSSFRGKSSVLLAFFPLAFTSVCTTELCDFSQGFSEFAGLDATILGISVDSIPTLKEFRAKNGITVDLLSDFKREVSRRYGVLMEDKFHSRRAYFIVDREGVLRWSHVEDETRHKRENAELIAELARLG
jgi:peroxiredoxin